MSLRIVMVSASFYPHVGGAENQALELSRELKRRAHEVTVLTRRRADAAGREEVRGIAVERLWCVGRGAVNSLSFMVSLFFRLWSGADGYDVIHVHLASSPALAAIAVGRLRGKKVVIKIGGGRGIGELALSAASAFGRLKLSIFRWAQPTFVAVSKGVRDEARLYLGDVPLHVIANGVDSGRFHPADEGLRRRCRAELGWPEALIFLYAGRFDPVKNLPAFLEAWAEASGRSKTPSFLAFVGEGADQSHIEEARDKRALGPRIAIRPPMAQIEHAYAAADVFVLPSSSEGLSNALLEAMASGLAILASDAGGNAEAVTNGDSGLLFKADDPGELKSQLNKLFSHPELSRRLGQTAHARALARYSLSKTAEQYEVLYRLK